MSSVMKKAFITVAIALLAIITVNTSDVYAKKTYTVTFIYGNTVDTQQVAKGQNAVIPVNTAFPGYTFAGWTDTGANIQCDKTILGMYIPNSIQPVPSTGKAIKYNNNITAPGCDWWDYSLKGEPGKTCVVRWYNGSNGELWKIDVVPYGTTLDDPGNPCLAGLEFLGWEGSWENITEDRNIRAWYIKNQRIFAPWRSCIY